MVSFSRAMAAPSSLDASSDDPLAQLVLEIRHKKELRGISDAFVRKEIDRTLMQEPRFNIVLQRWNPRAAIHKQLVKNVRERLRKVYGLFRVSEGGLTLETHPSTRERGSFYPKLYQHIFAVTGKPQVILDLGCGLNPLSIPLMKLKELTYYGHDLSETEIKVLNSFFRELQARNARFRGIASVLDITNIEDVRKLPPADIAFLFKVTDVLDQQRGHRTTEEVLRAVPARHVAISFSTLTMSGKPMTAPRRRWVEWLCRRLGYTYTVLEFKNEIVYVIEKKSN